MVYMVTTMAADRVRYAVYAGGGEAGGRGPCCWETEVWFGAKARRRAGGAAFVAAAREQARQAEACAAQTAGVGSRVSR